MIAEVENYVAKRSWLTGVQVIDEATNGLPFVSTGISGNAGSGKTTLVLAVIAKAQQNGLWTLFIDNAGTLDRSRAKRIGVSLSDLIVKRTMPVRSPVMEGPGLIVADAMDSLPNRLGMRKLHRSVFGQPGIRLIITGRNNSLGPLSVIRYYCSTVINLHKCRGLADDLVKMKIEVRKHRLYRHLENYGEDLPVLNIALSS